jgi:hypothetical protein
MKTAIILKLGKIEDEVLNIIENKDDLTTSDLQGCIQAQLLNAYQLGKNEK